MSRKESYLHQSINIFLDVIRFGHMTQQYQVLICLQLVD